MVNEGACVIITHAAAATVPTTMQQISNPRLPDVRHHPGEFAPARNVTDESCSDPSVGDADSAKEASHNNGSRGMDVPAERKVARKRSSRDMTAVRPENSTSSGAPPAAASPDGASSSATQQKIAAVAQHHQNNNLNPSSSNDQSTIDDEDFEIALSWNRNNRVLLRRLEETAPLGKLSMINLARRGIGQQEALLLHEVIRLNPMLSVLKLGYNELGDTGTSVIAKAFIQDGKHHPKLTVLDLGFNEVGDLGCEALALLALAGNFSLSQLYLSGNVIGETGALAIAGAILHGTGLSVLHITGNTIGSKGIKAIAGAIAKQDAVAAQLTQQQHREGVSMVAPTVTELHIGSTGVDSTGFIAIPGMILSNSSLRTLSIPNNNLNDQDMLMLSQALTQNKNIPLEKLELSFNEISDQGVECVMNAVWGSPTLKVVKFDNNRLQDRGAQLCAVVLTAIPLEVLDLSFNRISTSGIKALMKNISDCESLKSLGFSGIPVDQNASKALAYALAYNSSLTTLNLDNCSMGYSAQRHIVAGVISNRRVALRVITGFPITQIAMTLGLPRLPDWSNVQVLGFVRLMWQQWLLKSGHGRIANAQDIRGPAPPAAVASAAKIAFSSLGVAPEKLFKAERHELPFAEGPPVDPAKTALLERTDSGTLNIPSFSPDAAGELHEWVEEDIVHHTAESANSALTVSHLEDPARRNKNLKWLRTHFRSLSEVGRLPFNNADLWQLHQYYFSPPVGDADGDEGATNPGDGALATERSPSVPQNSPVQSSEGKSMGRAISFTSLGAALAVSNNPSLNDHKRGTDAIELPDAPVSETEPMSKRAKCLKPRIAFYPRVMAKIQSLGTRPMDQTLSLLRQLKYTENVFFETKNPYEDTTLKDTVHQDVEMILLDLL